jgi:hypothetical protein
MREAMDRIVGEDDLDFMDLFSLRGDLNCFCILPYISFFTDPLAEANGNDVFADCVR